MSIQQTRKLLWFRLISYVWLITDPLNTVSIGANVDMIQYQMDQINALELQIFLRTSRNDMNTCDRHFLSYIIEN